MHFFQQEFLSNSTLLTISCLMVVAGLICSKGTVDLYTSLLMVILAGMFFLVRDYFPPTLVYIIAIVAIVMAVFSQSSLSYSGYTLQLMALAVVLFFCQLYLLPAVLLNLAIIVTLVIAFIFLI